MKNICNFFLLILSVSLLTAACGNEENRSKSCFDYLAVQLEEGDYWSIMDANGNIVVDRRKPLSVPSPFQRHILPSVCWKFVQAVI